MEIFRDFLTSSTMSSKEGNNGELVSVRRCQKPLLIASPFLVNGKQKVQGVCRKLWLSNSIVKAFGIPCKQFSVVMVRLLMSFLRIVGILS